MTYDTTVFQKLALLAECLCGTLVRHGLPEPCFCGLMPGAEVALDYLGNCENQCGMAWVRLDVASPTTGIGVVSEQVNNCSSTLGFDVEVGIIRCMPAGDDGEPPAQDVLLAATDLQVADMMAIREAMACCPDMGDFILGIYQPYGPTGLAFGGFWTGTYAEV